MPDRAKQQLALADLFVEMMLLGLTPDPLPPPPLVPADVEQALERLAEAMTVMYPDRS